MIDNEPLKNTVYDVLCYTPKNAQVVELIRVVAEEVHEDLFNLINEEPERSFLQKKIFMEKMEDILKTKYGSEFSKEDD